MTPEELEKRLRRAQEEQMVIMQVEEGIRVYAPNVPQRAYIVAGSADVPTCTCPDFQHHQQDPAWRCKHILAVQAWREGKTAPAPERQNQPPGSISQPENSSHMVVKRSVSPDGRIDSLSVEFSVPIGGVSPQQVASLAERSIRLGSGIAEGFRRNHNGPSHVTARESQDLTPAVIEGVGGMDTKWGRRLFLNIRVEV